MEDTETVRKDIDYVHECVTKDWMERNFGNKVADSRGIME